MDRNPFEGLGDLRIIISIRICDCGSCLHYLIGGNNLGSIHIYTQLYRFDLSGLRLALILHVVPEPVNIDVGLAILVDIGITINTNE